MKSFIEPLSSSTRAKSIGVAQGGLGEGGGDGGGDGDGDGGGEVAGGDGGQNLQVRSQFTMKWICLHLVIMPMSVPTSFWQYPGSLGLFLSMHGDGGGGVGGMGGGQRGAQNFLHARTAGS